MATGVWLYIMFYTCIISVVQSSCDARGCFFKQNSENVWHVQYYDAARVARAQT